MTHNNHVLDGRNKDVDRVGFNASYEEAKEYYLKLAEGWIPYNPDPVVRVHEGVRVVRDDLIVGTKTRAGDLLASKLNHSRIVYCQPRSGLAGVSILDVARHHDKDVTLFMPACEKISLHQACCAEQGAELRFRRIAAMPNLKKYAMEWADENEGAFVPLGLQHELATAGIVHAASTIPEPEVVYVAISTGVLSRALQIAWPNAEFHLVAVARNLKAGEAGRAVEVISAPEPFQKPVRGEDLPPFPTVATYDGKVWRSIPKNSDKDILFWNVGKDPELKDPSIIDRIDSNVKWREPAKVFSAGVPNLVR